MTLSPTWNVTCPPLSKVCRLGSTPAEQSFQYSGTCSGRQRKTHKNWPFFGIFVNYSRSRQEDFFSRRRELYPRRSFLSAFPERGCDQMPEASRGGRMWESSTLQLVLLLATALLAAGPAPATPRALVQNLAPFIPTPDDVVDR